MDKTTILVIEDNEEVRDNLQEVLELYGYNTLAEANGLAGVKTALESPPDLILCDIMMPELDGFGVLNLLSENERTAGIPFVFLTAKTETGDIRRGMNLGADDYITKPFFKDELLHVIKIRLNRAKARTQANSLLHPPVHLSNPVGGRDRLENSFRNFGHKVSLPQGESLVREGEYPHFIGLVVKGRLHLSRTHEFGRNYIIAELSEGEVFGVPSVLERSPFHYTAKAAAGGATVQTLPTGKLLKLLNTDRTITEALMHLMANRVVAHGERLVQQAYDSVRRRTALVLCDLHEKYGGGPIELSRDELAQMVGATKESVIRALSDFKREGLVEVEGKGLALSNVESLRGLLV